MFDPIMNRRLAQIQCQERLQLAEQARQPRVRLEYNPSWFQRVRIALTIQVVILRRRLRAGAAQTSLGHNM